MPITRVSQFTTSERTSGSDQDETNYTSVKKLFNYVLLLMKISGVFIDRKAKNGTVSYVMIWFYSLFLLFVYIADSVRFLFIYKDEEFRKLSSRSAGIFSLTIYSTIGSILVTGFLYLNSKHVPKIMRVLSSYAERYGVIFKPKFVKQQRRKVVMMAIVNIIFNSVLLGLTLVFLPEETIIMTILVYFPYSNYLEKLVPISFICIKMVFLALGLTAVNSFGHQFIDLIGREYSKVTKKVSELAECNNTDDIEECMEYYRKQHECLTALVRMANPVLQFTIFITYSSGIPVMCFLLYGIAGSGLETIDLIILMEFFFGALSGLLYCTLMGAGLNSKAHEVKDVLFQFDLKRLSEKTTRQLQIFISRVNGPPIGINVYDMFTVDKSSLLMLFGTILTYSIVIFQTTGPTTCNVTNNSEVTTVSTSNMTS